MFINISFNIFAKEVRSFLAYARVKSPTTPGESPLQNSQTTVTQRFTQALRSQRNTLFPTTHPMNKNETDNKAVWFAMSAPYRRELKAREFLATRGIESFVPMTKAIVEKGHTKSSKIVPAIHNLIFVHTTKEIIQQVKQGVDYLQYRTFPTDGKNRPIIVPDKEMEQFIAVTRERMDELTYLKPEDIDIAQGTRVRIHGGTFDGTEGIFVKIKGKRKRRVVVLIEGLAAVTINAEISPDLIEIL